MLSNTRRFERKASDACWDLNYYFYACGNFVRWRECKTFKQGSFPLLPAQLEHNSFSQSSNALTRSVKLNNDFCIHFTPVIFQLNCISHNWRIGNWHCKWSALIQLGVPQIKLKDICIFLMVLLSAQRHRHSTAPRDCRHGSRRSAVQPRCNHNHALSSHCPATIPSTPSTVKHETMSNLFNFVVAAPKRSAQRGFNI